MTITCASSRTSAGISSPHVIARASAPSRCRSSRNIGTTSSATGPQARNDIISWTSSSDGGGGSTQPRVAVRDDRRQRPPARLGHLLLGHGALVVVEHRDVRPQVAADPRRVAGDVHHRAQQGRDAHVLERGGDGGVVVGERAAGVRVAIGVGHGTRIRARPSDRPPRSLQARPVGVVDTACGPRDTSGAGARAWRSRRSPSACSSPRACPRRRPACRRGRSW